MRHYAVPSLLLHLGGSSAGAGRGPGEAGGGGSGRSLYSLTPSSGMRAGRSPTHMQSRLVLLVFYFPELLLLY